MKKIIFGLLLITCQASFGQYKAEPLVLIPLVISGSADAIAENIKFHKLGAGKPFWDMKTSWQRKWKNGRIEQGERFLGSSTVFVAATDGYHLMRFIRGSGLLVAFAFSLAEGEKGKKWYYYVITAAVNMLAYKASFAITYYLTD